MNQSQINLTAVDLQISRLNPEISRRSVSETYVNSMIYWKPRCSGCDEKSIIDVRFRNQKNKGSPKLRFGSPCVINTAKVSWKKNHHLYATKQIFSKRITDLTLQYFSSSGQCICRCRESAIVVLSVGHVSRPVYPLPGLGLAGGRPALPGLSLAKALATIVRPGYDSDHFQLCLCIRLKRKINKKANKINKYKQTCFAALREA